ncbi:MAG: diadenylate cyclase CdaA, partial [Eubacteriales bacterium]|nr:diadenylate cyclase CdaA [Eubacteriales bacterium]
MPSFFSRLGEFFSGIWQSMTDGLLFLGGPIDMFVSALDILITTLVFYFILKLFRDSRAWQLLRGILLIIAFAIVTSFLGLNTISFIFNNTISILAIALLVIFQPELRKTLEKLGRSRLVKVISPKERENAVDSGSRHLIESIVSACESMSKTRTGALIIIERSTRLGELQSQENAVQVDSSVSTTLLKQIFYTGSPLHDGAVLIREGRIAAARIHVPLSDAYHLRHEFGTRHRAAVGASELGDAIAVVVSEER